MERYQGIFSGFLREYLINLKGREPQGTVELEDYDQLREQIVSRLFRLVDPDTGEKVVHSVYKREELYRGRHLEKAADLIVRWSDGGYHSVQRFGTKEESVFGDLLSFHLTNLEFSGCHRMDGIFAAKGKNIRNGTKIEGAQIIDVAPTILYLLGLPVPEDMDGEVLRDIFSQGYLESYPIKYCKVEADASGGSAQEDYSDADSDAIRERLKALGYIE